MLFIVNAELCLVNCSAACAPMVAAAGRPRHARPAVGDMMRIKQVMVNLLSNAVKRTHEGSVRLVPRVTLPPLPKGWSRCAGFCTESARGTWLATPWLPTQPRPG